MCQRCASTGRKCDGYASSAVPAQSSTISYTPPQLPLPSMPGLDLNSTQEQEAFHFFKLHTASEVSKPAIQHVPSLSTAVVWFLRLELLAV
jgi:hypothetical protein